MYHTYVLLLMVSSLIAVSGCDDFVVVDLPGSDLSRESVFTDDASAEGAMADIYFQIGTTGFAGGGLNSVSFVTSLSSDELVNGITFDESYRQLNTNDIIPSNMRITAIWQDMYSCIYKCNAILEGLALSNSLQKELKDQLTGEARFFRAFAHFYLVNLFGDVPLVLNTNYKINQNIPRTPSGDVYDQIVTDLLVAETVLRAGYSFSENERIRVNQAGATAMLARVYLYLGDWSRAERKATQLLNNEHYVLEPDLKNVFLKNNGEAILQLYPAFGYPGDYSAFGFYGCNVSPSLLNVFEDSDQRKLVWVNSETPFKYSSNTRYAEYSTVLRLSEQYLIRAEALARQGNIVAARNDLNVIRNRAGLENTFATDHSSILAALEKERRAELFLEWGHRWLDLKRTNRIHEVMGDLRPGYQQTDALYPIPEIQIENDPAMKDAQNPGY